MQNSFFLSLQQNHIAPPIDIFSPCIRFILFVFLASQDISRSEELIITDRKSPTTDSLMIEPTTHQESVAEAETEAPLPIYRSHIQKRNINLGRYYDGMMRATLSQLPTHDLRCNLSLTPSPVLRIDETDMNNEAEGVNEETVRKGRLLLDSINQPTPETPPIIISQR